MTINLMELVEKNIVKDGGHNINVPIKKANGESYSGKTYMIPLEYLYYNDHNGRIGVALSEYESKSGKIKPGHNEEYNMIIQDMLVNNSKKTNKEMDTLKSNVLLKGQEVPGYVLNDGRVIDGNRRFTAKRLLDQDENVIDAQYFEAVILEGLSLENHYDHKLIKSLELQIQFGRVEKVEYDPIDRAIDAYKTICKEEIMEVKEYAMYANLKETEVKKRILEAELILKFLDYANSDSDNYSLAKQLELDGPIQEIIGTYKKIKGKENETAVLNSLFAKIIQLKFDKEDFKKEFRDIVKNVIGTKKEQEFIEDMEEATDVIQDVLSEGDLINNNIEFMKVLQENEEIVLSLKTVKDVTEETAEAVKNIKDKNLPEVLSKRALNSLDSIDVSTVEELEEKDKEILHKILTVIQETAEELKGL